MVRGMDMTVLQVCAFGAEQPGNFIASMEALEYALADKGIRTIYAFIERAQDKDWCKNICKRTKVYFLPEAKARILPKTYNIMRRIYKENDVDILHTHFELYDIPATVTAPKATKVFWHLHDVLEIQKNLRGLLWKIQYGVVGKRATLLSVSEKHGKQTVQLGFPEEQVVYFPNAIELKRIKTTPLYKHENNILIFGWDVIRKGVDLLIRSADKVKATDYKIWIVGGDLCKSYLDENGSNANIYYREPVKDVNELFAMTKFFLHISRAEGLSYALLEVIYAGIPVICSDIPENLFAKEFKNVFFVKSENIKEISEEIDQLLNWDGIVNEDDVAYNREIIRKKYAVSAWVDRMIKQYNI